MSTPGPHRTTPSAVPHYYGDVVRILMLCGAGLALISAAFSTGFMHDAFIIDVIAALAIVAFAALTNPFTSWIILGDALLSGAVVVLFEIDAFANYENGNLVTFVLYEAVAILFIVAFYFSFKTLRAFALHQIGKENSAADFNMNSKNSQHKPQPLGSENAYTPDFLGD